MSSYKIVSLTLLKELIFFISALTPNSVSVSFIIEILTSTLSCPLSLEALSEDFLNDIRSEIPVLPSERKKNYILLGVSEKDAKTLVKSKEISDYFDKRNL